MHISLCPYQQHGFLHLPNFTGGSLFTFTGDSCNYFKAVIKIIHWFRGQSPNIGISERQTRETWETLLFPHTFNRALWSNIQTGLLWSFKKEIPMLLWVRVWPVGHQFSGPPSRCLKSLNLPFCRPRQYNLFSIE